MSLLIYFKDQTYFATKMINTQIALKNKSANKITFTNKRKSISINSMILNVNMIINIHYR